MKKGKKKTKKKANRKRTRKPTRKPRRRLTTRTVGLLHNGSSVTFGGVGGPVQQDLRNALPGEVVIDAWYAADPHSPPIDEIADNLIAAAVRAGRRNYVIVAAGGPETAVMFREKTRLMLNPPAIVFTTVTNPGPATVNNPGGLGLVNNVYGRGGTNLTGMWGQTSERDSDRLEILFQLVQANITGPQDKIGALAAQRRPGKDLQFHDLDPTAVQLGLNPRQQLRRSPHDADDIVGIGQAFNFFGDHANRFQGVVVMADSLFNDLREALVPIANASGLPTIYQWKAFVEAGGLVSFGPNIRDAYAMAGQYATRILDPLGEEPENMQVSTPDPSTFEVWMKISTAQLLNMPIPATVRAGGIVYRVNTIL